MKKNSELILPYLTEKEHIKAVKRKVRLGRLLSFMPLKKWLEITEKNLSKVRNPDSEFVTVPSGVGHYFKETCRREDFFPPKDMDFEGRRFSVMNNPQAYLTGRYGEDYMTPPDEKNRYEHHAVMKFELK
jgi:lipopolysaccharide cholinephosphotransferase